ncbi:MAG: glycosyl hydrolase [Mucilaginibacter polytrichastri]|nr:glycosyl hydrolase [Mucilaginibacter polytrichastri]
MKKRAVFCFLLLGFACPEEPFSPVIFKRVHAIPALDFLNSIGVNSAVSRRGETLEQTIAAIRFTGIRWIRSGYEAGSAMDDLYTLHRETGAKFSYGLLSGGTDIGRLLRDGRRLDSAGALLAFEGPNEPNNWGLNYQQKKGGEKGSWLAVAMLQRDLYKAVKSDLQLRHYPVWSLSENGAQTDNLGLQFLRIPEHAGTLMPAGTVYADFANAHNYFRHPSHPGLYDNQTWNAADPGENCKVDGLYGNYGKTWSGKFPGYDEAALKKLPRVTTETGTTIGDDLNEEQHGKMILNMYLSQFARGWTYTALYLLRDRTDEAGNQRFGLYAPDHTPRKAAHYLHNLTRILSDKGNHRKMQGEMSYALSPKPETVHDLMLRKSDGSYWLVLWNERVKGSDTVHFAVDRSGSRLAVFDPTVSAKALKTIKGAVLRLSLSDHPVIIRITP